MIDHAEGRPVPMHEAGSRAHRKQLAAAATCMCRHQSLVANANAEDRGSRAGLATAVRYWIDERLDDPAEGH